MARLGYAPASTADQDTAMQIQDLETAGCERMYRDHGISGSKPSRPELDRMLDRLSQGDEVIVWKLDRLGRNTRHLLELLDDFKVRGIKFRSLRDGIATDPSSDLGGAMAQAMVTIISAFAQLERDQLSERTKASLAIAASHGRKAGRQEVTATHPNVKQAHLLKTQGLKPADIGKTIGASRATVYRYLQPTRPPLERLNRCVQVCTEQRLFCADEKGQLTIRHSSAQLGKDNSSCAAGY